MAATERAARAEATHDVITASAGRVAHDAPITPTVMRVQEQEASTLNEQLRQHELTKALGIRPEDTMTISLQDANESSLQIAAPLDIAPTVTPNSEITPLRLHDSVEDAIVVQQFAEIIKTSESNFDEETPSAVSTAGDAMLVPPFTPDIEALPDWPSVETDETSGKIAAATAENADGEELGLSEADIQLLEEWVVLMAGAQPEDFAETAEDEISATADYQQILEQLIPSVEIPSNADEIALATEINGAGSQEDAEIPAAVTLVLALAVEQIGEHIALLDSEEVAEAHVLLVDVSHELQALEKALLSYGAIKTTEVIEAPGVIEGEEAHLKPVVESIALPEIAEAESALIESLQRLCAHIGLDYSEIQITQLVQQLLEQQIGAINLNDYAATDSGEINQIDLDTGMHEALSWFLSSIKQYKKQTDWLHMHVFLGRQAMASLPDIFTV